MAQNVVASVSAVINIDQDEMLRQSIDALNKAQSYANGHTITYKITGDKSELEKVVKQIEGLKPDIKTNIRLDFDSSDLTQQMDQLQKYINQDAKDIGKDFKKTLTASFQGINIKDVIGGQIGESAEVSVDNLKKAFKSLRQQVGQFDMSKVTSLDDITKQATALKQLSLVTAELQKQGVKNYGNLKLEPYGQKVAQNLENVFSQSGEVIFKNATQWAEQIKNVYEDAFGSIKDMITNMMNGNVGTGGTGGGFASNLETEIAKVKAELEEALKLQEQLGQRKPISSKQLQLSYDNIATKKNGEAAFVKDFQQYVKNGAKVEKLNKELIDGYNYLSNRKDFIPIEQLKEYAQQVATVDANVEHLSQRLEELQHQAATGGTGGTGTGGTGGVGSTSDEEVEKLKKQLEEAQAKFKEFEAIVEKNQGDLETYESAVKRLNERIEELQQSIANFDKGQVSIVDFEAEQAKIQELTDMIQRLRSFLEAEQAKTKELSGKVETQQQELSKAEQLNAQLQQNNQRLLEANKLYAEQNAEATKAQKAYDAIADKVDRINHFLINMKKYSVDAFQVATDALNKEYSPLIDAKQKDKAAFYYGQYRDAGGQDPLLMNGTDVTEEILNRYKALRQEYTKAANGGEKEAEQIWRQLQAVASATNQQIMALEKQNEELRETLALLQQEEDVVDTIAKKEKASSDTKANKNQHTKKTKMSAEEFKKAMLKDKGVSSDSDNSDVVVGTGNKVKIIPDTSTFKEDAEKALRDITLDPKEVKLTPVVGNDNAEDAANTDNQQQEQRDLQAELEETKIKLKELVTSWVELNAQKQSIQFTGNMPLAREIENMSLETDDLVNGLKEAVSFYKQLSKSYKSGQRMSFQDALGSTRFGIANLDDLQYQRKYIAAYMQKMNDEGISYEGLLGKTVEKEVSGTFNKYVKGLQEWTAESKRVEAANAEVDASITKITNTVHELLAALGNVDVLGMANFSGMTNKFSMELNGDDIDSLVDKLLKYSGILKQIQNQTMKSTPNANTESTTQYPDQSPAITEESKSVDAVTASVQALEQAVDRKTQAFREEEQVVAGTVQSEISNLEALDGQLFTILQTIDKIKQHMPLMLDMQMPDGLDTVQSQIATFISDLKESLNGLDLSALQSLTSSFNTLNVKEAVSTNVQRLADAVLHFKTNLDSISPSGSEFLKSVKELVAQGDSLRNLATVLSATKDQIKQAQDEIAAQNQNIDIAVGTKEWDDIYHAAKKYKKELGEIQSITYSMRQDKDGKALKSYKVTGSKSSITLGDNLNTVAEKETREYRKTAQEIAKIKSDFISAAQKSKIDFDMTSLKVDNQGVITFTTTVEQLGNTAEVTTYKLKDLSEALNKDKSLSKTALNSSAQNKRVITGDEKREQDELNASIKEYQALMAENNKLDAKNTKTRESNANYLLTQELKTVEQIAQTKAQIIQRDSQGKEASVLFKKLELQKQYMQSLAMEMQYYEGTVAYQERIAALRNKSAEVDLTVVQRAQAKVDDNKQAKADAVTLKRRQQIQKEQEAQAKAAQLLSEKEQKDALAAAEAEKKHAQEVADAQLKYEQEMLAKKKQENSEYITWWKTEYTGFFADLESQYKKLETVLSQQQPLRIKDLSDNLSADEQLKLNDLLRQEQSLRDEINRYRAIGVTNAEAELHLKEKQKALEETQFASLVNDETAQQKALLAVYTKLEEKLTKINELRIKSTKSDLTPVEQSNLVSLYNEEAVLLNTIEDYNKRHITDLQAANHLLEKRQTLEKNFRKAARAQYDKQSQQSLAELEKLYSASNPALDKINKLQIKKADKGISNNEQDQLNKLLAEQAQREAEIANYKKRGIRLDEEARALLQKKLALSKDLAEATGGQVYTTKSTQKKQYEKSMEIDSSLYINDVSQQLDKAKIALTQYFTELNDGTKRSEQEINDLNQSFNQQISLIQSLSSKDNLLNNNGLQHLGVLDGVDDIEQMKNKIISYLNTLDVGKVEFETFTQGHKAMIVSVRTADGQIQKQQISLKKYAGAVDEARVAIYGLYKGEKAYASAGAQWMSGLKSKIIQLTQYISGIEILMRAWAELKRGFEIIRELDTALTEMRKVFDETIDSLKNFQSESFAIANSVGATATTIQNSTAAWMRLGETLDQAAESAKVANILLNVSEFESIDAATDSLVSMSQAYKDLEKIDIVDKLNVIGNNFAISTDGLATALQRSASALTTAGNDINEAMALVTAGNAVVQDPDSVGAAMRTISLRLTGTKEAKAELEELGEEADDVITTTSKLRDTILSATRAASDDGKGFDILDDNGNYKSTYEIMLGLSELYDDIVAKDKELGTNNLNLLLETIAGKHFCLKFVETHFYRTHLIALIA